MPRINALSHLQMAHHLTHRSYASLFGEIFSLRFGPGKIGISEYFDFQLFKTDLTPTEKRAFCGYRGQAILEDILVDTYSSILSLDKLTFYQLMMSFGVPVPALRALYTEAWRSWPGKCLRNTVELERFLREEAHYPLYIKPSFGAYGRANTNIVARAGDGLILGDDSTVDIDSFCRQIVDKAGLGWLLQEVLSPHPDIAALCGNRISSIRIHPFLGNHGVAIHRIIWKINVGKLDSDNFQHGASGNMLANIDINTGTVTRVVSGVGFEQREIDRHPLTGMPLVGFKLPWFHEALDLVRKAAPAFPGFICQGWDIALCPQGPVALEVNMFGDTDLSQQSMRKGFLDDNLLALMRDRGLEPYLHMPADHNFINSTGRTGRRRGHWKF